MVDGSPGREREALRSPLHRIEESPDLLIPVSQHPNEGLCTKEVREREYAMHKLMAAVLCFPLIAATATQGSGQNGYHNRYSNHGNHDQFNRGAYQGGRHGDYGRDYRHYDQHKGGIGPGKGALIGGAGGAALGALFTGSAKGTIIGGAAGAGIGAILGKQAQDNRENQWRH